MQDDPLLQFLAENHRLKFIPFGGNGGDRLLQWCVKRLVEESASEVVEEGHDCLCYHGGGMFGYYDDVALLEDVPPGPEPLVFFPRACYWRGTDIMARYVAQFERMGRPLIIFARDEVSYGYFAELQRAVYCDLRLSHDAAILYDTIMEHDRDILLTTFRAPREDLVAVYRRTDCESAEWPRFTLKGQRCLHLDPAQIGFLSPEHTLTAIGQSAYLAYWAISYVPKVVVTDRLHVAIGRWLFGLPTILFPGREHKIKAAWERSLAPGPRGAVFVESFEELVWAVKAFGLTLAVERGI